MRKKSSAIYMIQNLKNHKMYVGGTTNVKSRKRQHFFELRNGIHKNRKLQGAYNEFGEDSFDFVILENLYEMNGDELTKREQAWIDTLEPEYNLTLIAGSFISEAIRSVEAKEKRRMSMVGREASDETKKKMSEAQKKRYAENPQARENQRWSQDRYAYQSNIMMGENNPNWGTKRSEDFKKMIGSMFASMEYVYISPSGEEVVFRNLTRFCKKNNLSYVTMRALHQGKRKTPYNGWTFKSKVFVGFNKKNE